MFQNKYAICVLRAKPCKITIKHLRTVKKNLTKIVYRWRSAEDSMSPWWRERYTSGIHNPGCIRNHWIPRPNRACPSWFYKCRSPERNLGIALEFV